MCVHECEGETQVGTRIVTLTLAAMHINSSSVPSLSPFSKYLHTANTEGMLTMYNDIHIQCVCGVTVGDRAGASAVVL